MNASRVVLIFSGVCLLSLAATVSSKIAPPGQNGMDSQTRILHEALMRPLADGFQAADVENLVIRRDRAVFELEKGRLYLCKPVAGRVCGVVFQGKGRFTLTAPNAIETQRIYRHYDSDTAKEEFKFLYIAFGDSTLEELSRQVTFGQKRVLGSIKRGLELCHTYFEQARGEHFYYPMLNTFMNEQRNDFFHAHFAKDERRPNVFRIHPYGAERVSFRRRQIEDPVYGFQDICRFNTTADEAAGLRPGQDELDRVAVEKYRINCFLNKFLKYSGSTSLDLQALRDNQTYFALVLYDELDVDSVMGENGTPVEFFKGENHGFIWIKSARPLDSGQTISLPVYYHGELVTRDLYWIEVEHLYHWYAKALTNRPSHYVITFHHPPRYTVLTAGRIDTLFTTNGVTTCRWKTKYPVFSPTFNIGQFDEYTEGSRNSTPVKVYRSTAGHKEAERFRMDFAESHNMKERIANDVSVAMVFLERRLGDAVLDTLRISEGEFLVSYRGGIVLGFWDFHQNERTGFDELTRTTYAARQWFGDNVRPNSYHDLWLETGLSAYMGLWILQEKTIGNRGFLDAMRSWRDLIYESQSGKLGKNKQDSPISAGARTVSVIRFEKAAFVFHMIRYLLRNIDAPDDDRFTALLRTYYQKYKLSKASTEDFQRILEEEMDSDMDWFFDQWVYGSHLPEYRYSYKTTEDGDGQFHVTLKVEDKRAPEDFKMIVPLLIEFPGDQFSRLRIVVGGTETIVELPVLPLEPRNIIFNYQLAVLAKSKKVKWKN
ncbi:MAG: hypothetical protein IH914_02230 [candidate division Zixibacteria bacterium]|nr:hypothetical protein [candidate division Zixibacteria bacterium]